MCLLIAVCSVPVSTLIASIYAVGRSTTNQPLSLPVCLTPPLLIISLGLRPHYLGHGRRRLAGHRQAHLPHHGRVLPDPGKQNSNCKKAKAKADAKVKAHTNTTLYHQLTPRHLPTKTHRTTTWTATATPRSSGRCVGGCGYGHQSTNHPSNQSTNQPTTARSPQHINRWARTSRTTSAPGSWCRRWTGPPRSSASSSRRTTGSTRRARCVFWLLRILGEIVRLLGWRRPHPCIYD